MTKTTASCPKCRQPVTLELTRLFDLNTDPDAKKKLLSGMANIVVCPHCGYQGPYPTPIVYHDPENELLLTFFPPEAGVPVNEQERIIGPLIKKVVDDLAPEKRKAYIFRPQTMLTQQRLFERILEADGITPEMMKAQQDRLALIQRLALIRPEAQAEAIQQDDDLIDDQLFLLLSRLIEASAASGDEAGAQKLGTLQEKLLEHSSFGRKLAHQTAETQQAITELQGLSKKGLTRESLLDLIIASEESEIRLATIVSMARGGLDYGFFQLLSERIDRTNEPDKSNLVALRQKLLDMTQEIDEAIKAQTDEASKLLSEILASDNVEEATQKALPQVTQIFVDLLRHELQNAQNTKDEPKAAKLQTIVKTLQAASASGIYLEVIDALVQAKDETEINKILEEAKEIINDDFLQLLSGLINQVESQGEEAAMVQRLRDINRSVLRFSMQQHLNKN